MTDPLPDSPQAAAQRPVVLVHGFLCPSAFLEPLAWRLRRGGYDAHRVHLSPLCIQDVRWLAAELRTNVDRVLRATGAERVDLVGISQGALIALQYLHHQGGTQQTARFVGIGSPLRGTWFALAGLPLLGPISRGVWQALPGSPVVQDLQARGAPAGVPTTLVSLEGDPVAPPDRCRLLGARHRVLPPAWAPGAHQWLVASRLASDAIVEALAAPWPEAPA